MNVDEPKIEQQAEEPFRAAVSYSAKGIVYAFHTETNLKRDVWLFTALAIVELVLRPTLTEVTVTLFVSMCVFAAELFNTAIELTVDVASNWRYHVVAGAAKDVASGAVTMISIGALCVACWLLTQVWPWHFWLLSRRHMPGAVMVLAALAVIWTFRCWPYRAETVIKRRRMEDTHEF
ncbi:diacylglycerol kinase [Alicyclobacillus acidiphilus]|uniref:diacylglycerol kinase n=1 Tax=Alicyclobacillus acidiphilus TaxID=182455 RepID=UPI0008365F8B|nr:diacylglycerol kinase [Alicyclobacillus acidiphilus]